MSLSMHAASIPVLNHYLESLLRLMDKAETHAKAKGFDPATLISARLAPDMFPLSRQIQIVSDQAKGCAARLSGIKPPVFEDKETTFDELRERIAKTLAFIGTVPASTVEGSEERDIHLKAGKNEFDFKGQFYLTHWVLPNFFFHLSMAYAILRHHGVDLGKMDFLGPVQSFSAN